MKSGFVKTSLSAAGLTIYAMLIVDVSSAQSADTLRWKLNQGDQLAVQLVQDTNISSQIDNRGRQTANKMTLDMQWLVESVNDDRKAVIQQTISRIQLTLTTPEDAGSQTVSIDTNDTDKQKDLAKHLLQQVSPLIGTKYTVTMSDRGEVVSVDVPEASMEALRGAPASMQLRQVLTKEGLTEMFGQSAIVFPEQAISVGDDWKSESEVSNSLGTFTRIHTYSYDSSQQKDQKTMQHISIKTELKQKAANQQGSELVAFSGGGQLWMDNEAGYVTESSLANELKTINKTYPSSIIYTTITSRVSMKVVKK